MKLACYMYHINANPIFDALHTCIPVLVIHTQFLNAQNIRFLTFDVLCHVKFLYPAQVLTSWEKYSRKVFSENLDSGKPLESRFKATS